MKMYDLPFETHINVHPDGAVNMSSELPKEVGKKAGDALDSFLIALAGEGFDMNDPRIANALETAVESIGNNS